MKNTYVTFGQTHVHSVNGKTFDKDCVDKSYVIGIELNHSTEVPKVKLLFLYILFNVSSRAYLSDFEYLYPGA